MKKTIALILAFMLLTMLFGCSAKRPAEPLSAEVIPQEVPDADLDTHNAPVTDFSFRLFQQCLGDEGKNVMISPFSVLCALAMTANGADGNTRSQMEEVFGISTQELNGYIHTYMQKLPNAEKYKLALANSIWFREGFSVKQNFLQTNANYYGAELQQLKFDNAALEKINAWCAEKTDGMITELLEEIPDAVMMYLINAVAFAAEWDDVYESSQVLPHEFTKTDGTKIPIDLMHSTENLYLEDDSATGFLKYYADRSYAFVALLPKQGTSAAEYAAQLTGEDFASLLRNSSADYRVHAGIPKFKSEYSTEMSEYLKEMGMTDAFSINADLSQISDADLFISRVLHKTSIIVDEKGTKAAAVTVVEAPAEDAPAEPEYKDVILDRPFLYAVIDCRNEIPLFIGIMNDPA